MRPWSAWVCLGVLYGTAAYAGSAPGYDKDAETRCRTEKDFAVAITNCTYVIEHAKDKVILEKYYNWRGLANLRSKEYASAVSDFSNVIKLNPKIAGYYDNRQNAYKGLQKYDLAMRDANTAIKLAPTYSFVFNGRASLYVELQRYDLAISDFTLALSLAPKDVGLLMGRGDAYQKTGNIELAIADFSDAYNHSWQIGALRRRGLANVLAKNYQQAVSDLRETLSALPTDKEVGDNLRFAEENFRFEDEVAHFTERHPISIAVEGTKPAMQCELDNDVRRCRPSSGALVWCKQPDKLAQIERDALASAYFSTDAVLKEVKNKMCGVTRFVEMGAGNKPQRTAEGDAIPYVSDRLFASLGSKGSYEIATPNEPPPSPYGSLNAATKPVISEPKPSVQGEPKIVPVDPKPRDIATVSTEKRIALVIGNSNYRNAPVLTNPALDAFSVSEQLERNGVLVTSLYDLTREQLVQALAKFSGEAESADWAMIYYAGHGIEISGTNYLIPIDAQLATDRSVKFEAIPLTQVIEAADGARKLKLVVIDACRANPFANRMQLAASSRASTRGLARPPEYDPGTLVVYAAREGEVASDGSGTGNSPFAAAFLKELKVPSVEIRRFFDLVRDDVIDATANHQHPFTYGSLPGRADFYLNRAGSPREP